MTVRLFTSINELHFVAKRGLRNKKFITLILLSSLCVLLGASKSIAQTKDAVGQSSATDFCIFTRYNDHNAQKNVVVQMRIANDFLSNFGLSNPATAKCVSTPEVNIYTTFPVFRAPSKEQRQSLSLAEGVIVATTITNGSGANIKAEDRLLRYEVQKAPNRMVSFDARGFDLAYRRLGADGNDVGERYYFKAGGSGAFAVRCNDARRKAYFCKLYGTHHSIPEVSFEVLMHGNLLDHSAQISERIQQLLTDFLVLVERP